ncbi:MAG: Hpt domain-containing protein, partial [Planctomycetota bacterium]|nr:Hpt domain-containing protein [Planctomycetota bacterium]
HGLKGSAANMGASALSKAAASLEHLSEEGDPKGLDGHLNDLVSLVRQTEAELADLAEISPAGASE